MSQFYKQRLLLKLRYRKLFTRSKIKSQNHILLEKLRDEKNKRVNKCNKIILRCIKTTITVFFFFTECRCLFRFTGTSEFTGIQIYLKLGFINVYGHKVNI